MPCSRPLRRRETQCEFSLDKLFGKCFLRTSQLSNAENRVSGTRLRLCALGNSSVSKSSTRRCNSHSSLNRNTMPSILALILVPSLMMCSQAQTWAGKYAVDPTVCNVTACCCLAGVLVVARESASILSVNSPLNGTQCGGATDFTYEGYYPAGYVTQFNMGGLTFAGTLSDDSRTIIAVDTWTVACNVRADRVGNVRTTSPKPISGAEERVISCMTIAAGILLAAISHIAH